LIYFILTTRKDVLSMPVIPLDSMSEIGFFPIGFFHRLVGKALTWCQETTLLTVDSDRPLVFGDMIQLTFIKQKFLMRVSHQHNCLEVLIDGENPLAIHHRLLAQIKEIIHECFPGLICIDAVAHPSRPNNNNYDNENCYLIPRSTLLSAVKNRTNISTYQGDINPYAYSSWLKRENIVSFDVFISYRWNQYDSNLTARVYDILSCYNHPKSDTNRAIHVFLDEERLKDGLELTESFSMALISSTVLVPIVSVHAIQRLITHDPNTIDNMLMEWLIGLEVASLHHRSNPKIRVRAIYPIFIHGKPISSSYWWSLLTGQLANNNEDDDLLRKGGALDRLPNIVPKATLDKALELLSECDIKPRAKFMNMTVKGVVDGIRAFKYNPRWDEDRREIKIGRAIVDVISNIPSL